MKIHVLLICLLVSLSSAFAQQDDCEEVKKENEYLRKALNILEPQSTATSSNIDFNLIKCEGNKESQTVTVWLTVVNKDTNKTLQFSFETKAIDVEGNEFKPNDLKIGSSARSTIYTDTPIKASIVFNKILPSVQMLKLVNISYYDPERAGREISFSFKDIKIDWK